MGGGGRAGARAARACLAPRRGATLTRYKIESLLSLLIEPTPKNDLILFNNPLSFWCNPTWKDAKTSQPVLHLRIFSYLNSKTTLSINKTGNSPRI